MPMISAYSQHAELVVQGAASVALLDTDPMHSTDPPFQPARLRIDLPDACFGAGELLLRAGK